MTASTPTVPKVSSATSNAIFFNSISSIPTHPRIKTYINFLVRCSTKMPDFIKLSDMDGITTISIANGDCLKISNEPKDIGFYREEDVKTARIPDDDDFHVLFSKFDSRIFTQSFSSQSEYSQEYQKLKESDAAFADSPPPIHVESVRSEFSQRKVKFIFNSQNAHHSEKKIYESSRACRKSYLWLKKTITTFGYPASIFEFDDTTKSIYCHAPLQYFKDDMMLIMAIGAVFQNPFLNGYIYRPDAMDYMHRFIPAAEPSPHHTVKPSFSEKAHEFFASKTLIPKPKISNFKELLNHSFCIGESHSSTSSKRFAIENMTIFREAGYKTLFMEHLFYDSVMQDSLDEYFHTPADTEMPKDLSRYLDNLFRGYTRFSCEDADHDNYNFSQLVKVAKEAGIRIVGIDTEESYKMGMSRFGAEGAERMIGMNYAAQDIITKEAGGEKWIALMGNAHIGVMEKVPGVSEILGVPSVDIFDQESPKSKQPESVVNFGDGIRSIKEREHIHNIHSDVRISCAKGQSLAIAAAVAASNTAAVKSLTKILEITDTKQIVVKTIADTQLNFFHPKFDGSNSSGDKFDFATNDRDVIRNPKDKSHEIILQNLTAAGKKVGIDSTKAGIFIMLAIKNGGVANQKEGFLKDLKKIFGEREDCDLLFNEARNFSAAFQKNMEESSMFTGNQNAKKLVGMRLKRLTPNYVLEMCGILQDSRSAAQTFERSLKILEISVEDLKQKNTTPSPDPRDGYAQRGGASARTK